eukprot:c6930_g1_i1.p2 GENE.c6930_g1_i1~~c6930_g1_i1.p2  ORF type:complete len:105 (-),score=16.04 c6930_g1_i1:98-412(-)
MSTSILVVSAIDLVEFHVRSNCPGLLMSLSQSPSSHRGNCHNQEPSIQVQAKDQLHLVDSNSLSASNRQNPNICRNSSFCTYYTPKIRRRPTISSLHTKCDATF